MALSRLSRALGRPLTASVWPSSRAPLGVAVETEPRSLAMPQAAGSRAVQLQAASPAEAAAGGGRAIFRTSEADPGQHSERHAGQFYTLPPAEVKTLFPHGLPPRFQEQIQTFNEACVMVREPALELIGYLKRADYSQLSLRYVLYGEKGSGKTLSLCHALHYCSSQGWVILHVPDAHLWVKNCRELLPSSSRPSRFDQPIQASQWLRNFRVTNERFLSQIKTTRQYVWSKRESTDAGRPLGELVDQGLTRVKSSSDVASALMRELRGQCGGGAFRLAVAVDGVNALWGRTALRKEDKSPVAPEELTLVHNLRKMLRNDWCGGAVITTVTHTGSLYTPRSAYLPQELLGKEGFEALEPFVPVPVSVYSQKEFESCYQYYLDRRWLQHPHSHTEEGKKELIFLSSRNPSVLERLCGFL
ncbi:small ribosomal subunit protein mS29 isoform X1 [Lepisosteus oculatus]